MPASPESQALSETVVHPGIDAAFGRGPDADQPVLDALCWYEAVQLGRDDDLTDAEERRAQAGDGITRLIMEQVSAYRTANGL